MASARIMPDEASRRISVQRAASARSPIQGGLRENDTGLPRSESCLTATCADHIGQTDKRDLGAAIDEKASVILWVPAMSYFLEKR
ncbi:hypothetical protein CO660_18145 [Rhizobium sp. L9]|nr:hypothetical protein CO660_18145 [Rhizobium sp. L9]